MPQDLKERLIGVGTAMMRQHGYAGADITKVCREARVARAHFYRLIPGKPGLGLIAISRFSEERKVLVNEALTGGQTLKAQIESVFETLRTHQLDGRDSDDRVPGSAFAGFSSAVTEAPILQAVDDALEACRAQLESAIDAAVTSGEATGVNPKDAAMGIVAMIEGGLQLARVSGDANALRQLVPAALTVAGVR